VKYEIVVIGVSIGALNAMKTILGQLPSGFPLPIVIVIHRERFSDETLQILLAGFGNLPVIEPEDKDDFKPGTIYIAPPDYHLLFEEKHFSLSKDLPVNHARPSIDVLFESAAETFGSMAIGVILTGSSKDGAKGLAAIKKAGGLCIVQHPYEAESNILPTAALTLVPDAEILKLEEIVPNLLKNTK
jgi:two-component system, chemotaxis family, protein-glutamate methylesterase/glutaminase